MKPNHPTEKIAVFHAGPIGLSGALLLAQRHPVVLHDTNLATVDLINARRSPLDDPHMAAFLAHKPLRLRATADMAEALVNASLVLVATPTAGVAGQRLVDTRALDRTLRTIRECLPHTLTVIESAVPVGFTRRRRADFDFSQLMVAPALVRPRCALRDRLFPTTILVGEVSPAGQEHAQRMLRACQSPNTPVQLTGSGEAEAIHLFRQRAHFSETEPMPGAVVRYALRHGLDPRALLRGLDLKAVPELDDPITLPPPVEDGIVCGLNGTHRPPYRATSLSSPRLERKPSGAHRLGWSTAAAERDAA
jgi:UDPglucose 6-dehydrogenase